MTSKKQLLLNVALSFTLLTTSISSVYADGLQCRLLPPIMHGFLSHHVSVHKPDSALEAKSIDQFVKRVDPSKVYLYESDVAEIKNSLKGIFNKMTSGDCEPLKKAQNILAQRIEESAKKAAEILNNKDFAFDPKTEITIDPAKRVYPKNAEESTALLKKFIQFQISNYLASDMKLAQAKKQLIHRYELNVKRNKEMKEEDTFSLYLDSFAAALDAHSSYLSQDVLEDFEISMRLSLEGIGTSLSWDDGYTTIEAIIPGGSAEKSKEIKPKDKIIAVGQGKSGPTEPVIDVPLRDVVKLIRGKKGTYVRLTILRQGETAQTLIVTLKRETINLKEDAAKLSWVEKKSGDRKLKLAIIELPSFYGDMSQGSRSCYEDMYKLVEQAKKGNADGMILDLSKNGGGLLGEAVRIGGLFVKRGNVVATQDSKNSLDILSDDDEAIGYSGPLVVLTSRLSASASEIVAGALQDYKRALIVGGDHTFGKGTVQAVSNLPRDLGAIKVTTGMFFVPGGHSTQHRGVEADVALPSIFSSKEIGEKSLDYSLPPKTIAGFLSKEAQSSEKDTQWAPILKEEVDQLKILSSSRVAKDKDFQKIITELKEEEKRDGIIKLSDALSKQKTNKKEKKKKYNEDDSKYLELPHVKESIEILTDLIRIRNKHPLVEASFAGKAKN